MQGKPVTLDEFNAYVRDARKLPRRQRRHWEAEAMRINAKLRRALRAWGKRPGRNAGRVGDALRLAAACTFGTRTVRGLRVVKIEGRQ